MVSNIDNTIGEKSMSRMYLFVGVLLVAFLGCQKEQVEPKTAFADLPFEEQHATIMVKLQTVKQDLSNKGEYTCCIMPTCNWCLINSKHCACAGHLVKGETVCNGCVVGWKLGHGNVKGVQLENVKSSMM